MFSGADPRFDPFMTYSQSRFSKKQLWLFLCCGLFLTPAFSVEIPLEVRSFSPVAGGDVLGDGVKFYVSSFDDLAYQASNSSDIIVIEDITSLTVDENDEDNVDDDTYIFISNYYGYNTVTGETQESASLLMEVPAAYDSFYAGDATGFYRKTGPWTRVANDQQFLLEGMQGTISYQSLSKARDVEIKLNGSFDGTPFTLSGESTANVVTTEFVNISGWDTDESSDYSFSFVPATVRRDNNTYRGFLRRSDLEEPTDWESSYGIFQITDNNDSDGDGVPDFSDLGAAQILGILSTHSIDLSNNQYWSEDLNTTLSVDVKNFWIYGENIGWFYVPDQQDPYAIRIYIPDERLGWLVTNKDLSPYYLRESDNVSIYFDRVDGKVSFYDTGLEAWFTVEY